jgi:hypothetical protein
MNGHHVRVIVARLADAFSLKRAPLIGSDSSSSSSSSSILPDDFEDEDDAHTSFAMRTTHRPGVWCGKPRWRIRSNAREPRLKTALPGRHPSGSGILHK